MNEKINFTTPVGRFVLGSLYVPQTKDALGNALVFKTGADAGKPRSNYFFALAIAKNGEQHWSQTSWGKIIWDTGHAAFPQGQASSPAFAWKVIDGDSQVPNKRGTKPCDRTGYLGHWVLSFSSGFSQSLLADNGRRVLTEENAINLGDYVQVAASVAGNKSQQQPGVFLNHVHVCLAGYGERIVVRQEVDPATAGFDNSSLPAGASRTPVSNFTPPVAPAPTAAVAPMAPPHPAILTPAAVPRTMTPKANGIPYEVYTAGGWTDDRLIADGLMA